MACVLARTVRSAGFRVRALKPIETGCEERDGSLVPMDALALARAAEDPAPIERVCPVRLRLPAAPEAAALFENATIDPAAIEAAYAAAAGEADLVIVEGAGGLLVPILPGMDMAGLAQRLSLPVLIVARAALGTINHTLLTVEAALARGLRTVGVVISHTEPALSDANRRNLDVLLRALPVPALAELPHDADALEPALDVQAFLSQLDLG